MGFYFNVRCSYSRPSACVPAINQKRIAMTKSSNPMSGLKNTDGIHSRQIILRLGIGEDMKLMKVFVAVAIILLVFAGCAPGPNTVANLPDTDGEIAGFWMGLWHGFASPVMFIISLFNQSVEIYEVHNNGGWYSFGFMLGACVILSGGCHGTSRKRRRKHS